MNERDSETIVGIFNELNFSKIDDPILSDFLVINTCSVRENADNKLKGLLGKLKHLYEKKEKIPKVLVCGCMMQVEETREKILQDFPFISFVFGTQNIDELKTYLKGERRKKITILNNRKSILEGLPVERSFKYRALVNIMEGCNNFCSYCIVPYVRGREKSRTYSNIKNEIVEAINAGVKEIILLGQNVNSYNNDGLDFSNLLVKILELPILRLRYMTANPKDISDDLISLHKKYKNLMPSMHIPIQSGSSRILKLMNRKYTKEDYLKLIQKIKSINPDIEITTDIMVGFPGETEDDFLETLDVVNKVKFNSVFTFIYSKRPMTEAAKLSYDISKEELKDRFKRLTESIYKIMQDKNIGKVGKDFEIFVDKYDFKKKTFSGKAEDGSRINIEDNSQIKIGDIVKVHISKASVFYLMGKVLKKS
jgi:tRNA-2-methylthio-N6-dimethylallyladenosine synthase